MSDYVLLSDSTTDLPPGMTRDLDIALVPLSYIIDGVVYDDVWGERSENGIVSPTAPEFYELMRQGKTVTTSQVNTQRFYDFFFQYITAGQDIVYVAFSSGLSGTYEQACLAAKQLLENYPERRITVIDSYLASLGEGLYVYFAAQKRLAGASYDELVAYLIQIRMKMNGWVAVGDLNYLKQSGRLNAPTALVGSMLKLKPIITVDTIGRLIMTRAVRGKNRSLATLIDLVASKADDPTHNPIFISHTDCPELEAELHQMLEQRFAPPLIITSYIGPVIGSHIGPGTVALYFIGEERH